MTDIVKVAVVTGGASGIGAEICRYLAKSGSDIAIWDLNEAAMASMAAEITAMGRRATTCVVDISNQESIAAGIAKTHEDLGLVTIMVNSAGIHATGPIMEIDEATWDKVMAVNLKGAFLVTKAVVPDMEAAGWGRIIYISSSSAQTGSPDMCHYVASKGGVIALTKALAVELGPKGITVNNVPPGMVVTPMLRNLEGNGGIPGGVEAMASRLPVRKAGQPENMAAAVAFLASEEAGYITGHTLSVNGGRYFN
ncbi:SDR family NAD(P)-dependent oxidoreductase [Halioxenophilus sp. WMMB6]|uniref:SDR family NAD(P)-dependent oxidoreductase n=1 Tax=Halioxenophilus sp. WMMB6 TaxID=3073815 RepID=UPI00295E3C90|nr:SDR family NAD(P)-dependent oxidoreductase [Halioxenophilus sp. WMMB6]